MFETLLNAIDATDAQTGAHVRRVARYALIIAEAADLSPRERHVVERVALFHDIGKIHEALFDLIHDRARLTPTERSAITTHPRRGAAVLAPLAAFYPELQRGVLSHHERWDGRGYPRRIGGPSIPLAARIVTIADTIDAITVARRYSTARSFDASLRALQEGRGTQFDPELVDLVGLPPVSAALRMAWRDSTRAHRQRHRAAERRDAARTVARWTPDVTFRWRPGEWHQEGVDRMLHGAPGHPTPDRRRRTRRR